MTSTKKMEEDLKKREDNQKINKKMEDDLKNKMEDKQINQNHLVFSLSFPYTYFSPRRGYHKQNKIWGNKNWGAPPAPTLGTS